MEQLLHIKEPLTLLLARHEFTLLERRIYWAVLQSLKREQTLDMEQVQLSNKTFRIHVSDLYTSDSTKTNVNTAEVKKVVKRITSRKIEFEGIIDGEEEITSIVPFPLVRYRKGYIEIVMLANVVPYFINLSRGYSQYQLKAAISLTSEYAQLLYPMLCRFLDTGFWRIAVDDLRQLLQAEKYARYSNFKQRVIEYALAEIITKTDIDVSYGEQREGRFVRWLNFSIRRKREREKEYQAFVDEVQTAATLPLEERRRQVVSLFPYYHFSKRQMKEILDDEEKMNAFIRAESYVAQGVREIENPTAYIAASVFGHSRKRKVRED